MPEQPLPPRRGRPPSGAREAILRAAREVLEAEGVARLTTRAVATRAGVAEGSVFYHFADRAGLLRAVFADALAPLPAAAARALTPGEHRRAVLRFARAIETSLRDALPVMTAARADADLRPDLAEHMAAGELGPHRGVRAIGRYLRAEQEAGRVAPHADVDAAAALVVAACLMRASSHHGLAGTGTLPSLERLVDAALAPLATR